MIATVLTISAFTASGQGEALDHEVFYVSEIGNDSWSGRLAEPNDSGSDGPFASLRRAFDEISRLKEASDGRLTRPVTIHVRGTIYQDEPLVLTHDDSGTADCPITVIAHAGDEAVISGGKPITGWQKEGNFWVAEIPEAKDDNWKFRLLRVGDEWAVRARYPNYDPDDPIKGGWLFADWWGRPWERGRFGIGVTNTHTVGDTLEWDIIVPQSGKYTVWVRYAHNMKRYNIDSMDGRTTIGLKGKEAKELNNLPDTGDWSNFKWGRSAELEIAAGENTLVWRNAKGGGINLDAFILAIDPKWQPSEGVPDTGNDQLIVIQAEACARSMGTEMRIPIPEVGGTNDKIALSPDVVPDWKSWDGAEVHIFPAWGWVNAILDVKGFDPDTRVISVDCAQEIRTGNRFFIENVRESLDAPNEWYLDAELGRLFYIPKDPKFSGENVVAPTVDRLIELRGDPTNDRFVEHIRFVGLRFSDTDYTAPGGYYSPADATIWLSGARNCEIRECRFSNCGGYAVRLENRSRENRIVKNTMLGLGGGGVIMLGNNSNQPTANLVAANTIWDCGKIYKHVAGVYVTTGSDNRIIHNSIRRMPRYGISLKSYDSNAGSHRNIVEFNEIIDSNLETNDTGAIETLGRDRELSGNVIRYNYIRNVVGLKTDPTGGIMSPYFTWGIYLDDYSSGTTVFGNIVISTVLGGLCIHGGKNNIVENNIMIDGELHQIRLQPRDDFMTGNVFRRNVVVYRSDRAVLWYSYAHTWRPDRMSEVDNNLYWHTGGLDIERTDKPITPAGSYREWQALGFDANSLVSDPKLVENERGIPVPAEDSPVWSLGFERIPVEKIGPSGYAD